MAEPGDAEPLKSIRLDQQEDHEGAALTEQKLRYLGVKGTAKLAEALKFNTTVVELSIDGHRMCDDGAAALAEMLRRNSALQTLSAANNKVHASGAALIAEALQTNTRLTDISLRDNSIGDQGQGEPVLSCMCPCWSLATA